MSLGLVEEIQRSAMNPDVKVSTLLRQMKIAASKLAVASLEDWVEHELSGYENGVALPSYRKITGSPMVLTLYTGWQPLMLQKEVEFLRSSSVGNSVPDLEAHLTDDPNDKILKPYPAEFVMSLSKANGGQVTQAGCMLSSSSFRSILAAVRDLVLNWSITMEKANIRGEGLSFSQAEQKAAQTTQTIFNIDHIGAFTGVMGAGNTTGDITSSTIDVGKVEKLVNQIKSNSNALIQEGVGGEELQACLSMLESALQKPDQGLLRAGLQVLREIVVKTSTGLVSTGILATLHHLLGTGASS